MHLFTWLTKDAHGTGFRLKNAISNTASGNGSFKRARFAYHDAIILSCDITVLKAYLRIILTVRSNLHLIIGRIGVTDLFREI